MFVLILLNFKILHILVNTALALCGLFFYYYDSKPRNFPDNRIHLPLLPVYPPRLTAAAWHWIWTL